MGVSTIEEACTAAKQLLDKGVGCIELCGAFGPSGAKKVIETAGKSTPVGLPPICRNRKKDTSKPLAKRTELFLNPGLFFMSRPSQEGGIPSGLPSGSRQG